MKAALGVAAAVAAIAVGGGVVALTGSDAVNNVLNLSVQSKTSSTVTIGWTPPADCVNGFVYYVAGAKTSSTSSCAATSAKFSTASYNTGITVVTAVAGESGIDQRTSRQPLPRPQRRHPPTTTTTTSGANNGEARPDNGAPDRR